MVWKVVIAHAPGEESLAEKLACPLQKAGYEVAYRGTVLVGESFTEEASKALSAGGPVVLCATIKALGTGWAHRLVNTAHGQSSRKRVFAVRMEEQAYLEQLAADTAIAEYWKDSTRGINDLLQSLQKYYPLEPDGPTYTESLSVAFLDRPTGISIFNPDSLSRFRAELRESKEKELSAALDSVEFLRRSGLMRNGSLTITGILLFGHTPVNTIPSATAQFLVYEGKTKGADREPLDLRGTVIDQITGLYERISFRVRTRERVRQDSPQAEILYEYPMRTVREIIANALVHRDYEDFNRVVHVRLFDDRIEVLSPGSWMGRHLPADKAVTLEDLVSESVKRNLTLATVVSWIRLVEGEGSGLITAIEECRAISAPIPTVSSSDGYVRVTIYPRADWEQDETSGATAITPRALNQLPAVPADFVGRREELSELRDKIVREDATLVALRGLGGVGKTTLALKLADELRSSFTDGQIYLNLQGLSRNPLSSREALAYVIRSYYPEARLPQSEAELVALYRSVLYGRRALLVLDDAVSPEQVQPLIPPSGSLALITSRVRFSLPGLIVKDVESLSPADARAMLLAIAPRIGSRVDALARLCGYLPIALRLAASFLAQRPDLSVDEYMRRLETAHDEPGAFETSIRLSYDLLNQDLQAKWRSLAVFPSTFDRVAVAAVWDMDSSSADRILGELLSNSLIQWEGEEQRYRLHSLLRTFAESRMGDSEQETARRRHAFHYVQVLWQTSRLYEQGGEALRQGVALFDREWDNIRAGHSWAVAHSGEDEETARLCSDYPHAGAYLLDLHRHPRERIAWLEAALEAARRLNDSAAEAVHLGNLGNAYIGLGEVSRAATLYKAWLDAARRIGDRRGEGQALGNLGKAHLDLGEPDRAVEFFEEWLRIAQEIGDQRGIGIALGNLGNAYAVLGDSYRALDYYQQRLIVARSIGDRRGEGVTLGNLGAVSSGLGDLQHALELYEKRLAIARELGDRRGEGIALGSLGHTYSALEDGKRAIELYEQALRLLREVGDRQNETALAWELGKIHEREGNFSQAISWMETRVEYERETGHTEAEEHAVQVQHLRRRLGLVDSPSFQE